MVDRTELRRGLAAARPYLLSHHEPGEWHRCYAPSLFGRRVQVCARCLGIYPGIVAGGLVALTGLPLPSGLAVVAALPLPAFLDWAATAFTDRRGSNPVRTATGTALGYAYGLGLGTLFLDADLRVLAVGAAYGLLAGVALYCQRRRTRDG